MSILEGMSAADQVGGFTFFRGWTRILQRLCGSKCGARGRSGFINWSEKLRFCRHEGSEDLESELVILHEAWGNTLLPLVFVLVNSEVLGLMGSLMGIYFHPLIHLRSKSQSTASARSPAYASWLQTHRQNPWTDNDHPLLQIWGLFKQESSDRHTMQTGGRTDATNSIWQKKNSCLRFRSDFQFWGWKVGEIFPGGRLSQNVE